MSWTFPVAVARVVVVVVVVAVLFAGVPPGHDQPATVAVAAAGETGVTSVPQDYSVHSEKFDHAQVGIFYDGIGDRDNALRSFRADVRFNPTSSVAYSNLGVCLMRMSEYTQAHAVFSKALKLDPKDQTARENMHELRKFMQSTGDPGNSSNDYDDYDDSPATPGEMPTHGDVWTGTPEGYNDEDYYNDDDYADYESVGKDHGLRGTQVPSHATAASTGSLEDYSYDDDYEEDEDEELNPPPSTSSRSSSSTQTASQPPLPPRVPQIDRLKRLPIVLSTMTPSTVHLLAEDREGTTERVRIAPHSPEPLKGPAKTIALTDKASVIQFLQQEFRETYFEQFPVLIKTDGAFSNVASPDDIFKGKSCRYLGNKNVKPYRNVKYIRGTFQPADRKGLQTGKDMQRALLDGFTLQFYAVQFWLKDVARLSLTLSEKALGLPVNVNLYITPPNTARSVGPHADYQCSLMIQLRGQKRWRLWKRDELWLPVRSDQIRGRDEGDDNLQPNDFGPPYIDVTLSPGDILYVPRGCVHATSTPRDAKEASMHLTVGMEAMWDYGISNTWESVLGAGAFHHHSLVTEGYFRSLRDLRKTNISFRETASRTMLQGTPNEEDHARFKALLHQVIDNMGEDTLQSISEALHGNVHNFNVNLRKIFGFKGDETDYLA